MGTYESRGGGCLPWGGGSLLRRGVCKGGGLPEGVCPGGVCLGGAVSACLMRDVCPGGVLLPP